MNTRLSWDGLTDYSFSFSSKKFSLAKDAFIITHLMNPMPKIVDHNVIWFSNSSNNAKVYC